MRLAALLIGCGGLLLVALGWHGYGAYTTIRDMDSAARIETPNALALLNELTTSGVTVKPQIDARSRGAYARALEQFVLDGTGVLVGVVLVGAGLFVRINDR
jgi:hypothetical protein